MAELKAGCKALIIGGFYRANDGKAVDVVKFIKNGEPFEFEGQMYVDKPPRGDAWLITGDFIALIDGDARNMNFALMPAKYLMPIDGDVDLAVIDTKEFQRG